MTKKDNFKAVYDHAVKLLSNRLHTKGELRRKLVTRNYKPEEVDAALARLEELKVLNDERFAEIFLDNLIRYKTYGFYGLKLKLLQRGIDNTLAEKLLVENLDIETELKIAKKISDRSKDHSKLKEKLKRKGFRPEVIYGIIKP